MPQIFHAVRCAFCESFQSHLRGQKPKWKCVLCGETQSWVRVYCSGAAKDVRPVVQSLNAARGDAERSLESTLDQHHLMHGDGRNIHKEGASMYAQRSSGLALDTENWHQQQTSRVAGPSNLWKQQAPPHEEEECYVTALPDRCGGGGKKRTRERDTGNVGRRQQQQQQPPQQPWLFCSNSHNTTPPAFSSLNSGMSASRQPTSIAEQHIQPVDVFATHHQEHTRKPWDAYVPRQAQGQGCQHGAPWGACTTSEGLADCMGAQHGVLDHEPFFTSAPSEVFEEEVWRE